MNMKISKNKIVQGWSKSSYSFSDVYEVDYEKDICNILEIARRNKKVVSIRSGGNSYGDNTLNENQIIIDITKLNKIISFDKENGILKVEAGTNFFQILSFIVPHLYVPYVMPGSGKITVGGSLSNNVHGKNCFKEGFFSDHIISFKILLSDCRVLICSRNENVEIFMSAIYGFGLLGIIIEVEMKVKKITSFNLVTTEVKKNSFAKMLEYAISVQDESDYLISSLNFLNNGNRAGSGIISYSKFQEDSPIQFQLEKIPTLLFNLLPYDMIPFFTKKIFKYKDLSINLFELATKIKFNFLTKNRKNSQSTISKFHFPNNYLFPNYNSIYPYGFYEYQPFIPYNNIIKFYHQFLYICNKYNFRSFLTSFKLIKKQNDNILLNHTLDGFTLTFDFPKYPKEYKEQKNFFLELNDMLIKLNGKLYLGKTPILNKNQFHEMYPKINDFLKLKKNLDSDDIMQSSMYRRIFELYDEKYKENNYYNY